MEKTVKIAVHYYTRLSQVTPLDVITASMVRPSYITSEGGKEYFVEVLGEETELPL